jgi:DNA polymerase-4
MNACVENAAPVLLATPNNQFETPVQAANRAEITAAAGVVTAPEKRAWFPTRWWGRDKARAAERSPHIVHVDVDAFFASVEQVLNPKLAGKPVLVGRGVVASASYEAKFRGVKTAMSFRDALRICPKAIVVPGQYEHYADFAERVRRILETYTPTVETAALDDFYLDFAGTERLYPDYEATLRRLQAEILGRTGLSVSVGAARTKVVASIASRLERPRGFCIVEPGMEESFLAPLPVDKLHGIGHTHAGALAERGISTIGQLRMVPKPVLVAAFGDVIGQQIWERARGLDGREVMLPSTPKSVSRETTIEGGTIDTEFLGGLLEYLSERIGSTLREYGKQANTAEVRLRYVDHFSAHQSVRLMHPTNDERELLAAAKELFSKLFTRRVAIRHVGVSVANLDVDRRQNELFDTDANRRWYLNREVDKVRGRYGWNAVFYGKGLELREHYAAKKNGLVLSTPCLSR